MSAINRMLVVVCLFLLSSLGIRGSADARTSGCPPRPQEMPCLIASPAAGPVGTTVDVHGHIGSKFAWWRRAVKATPFIELDREFPDGCGGEGGTRSDTIRIAADGTVTGSFVVTSPEHCFQTDHYHPTTPGLYSIVAGCLACENGTFRVTAGATGALASTGWSSGDAIALAAIMTLGGLCCLPLARRRRTTN